MNLSACRPSLPLVLSGCKYTTDFETHKKKFYFFSPLLELVSSSKRMQTYNLFPTQNKQNFKLFSENFFSFGLCPCWDHNSRSYDHLLRLKAAANLQPFLNSFQNKFQIFFRERFASIPHSYWAYNAAVKAFVVSQSGCKYTPVFKSRKSKEQLF